MVQSNRSSPARHGVSRLEVPEARAGQRLDNFLARHCKGMPKGALYRLIRTGQVRVNGGRARPDRRLEAGDVVRVPPSAYRRPGAASISEAVCRQVQAAIIHEDENMIVVDKPSGMAVHGGSGLSWGLIDAVRKIRPGKHVELVHRIDRETSGCVVLACGGEALKQLSALFRKGRVRKRYLCLLDGRLAEPVVEVAVPIASGRKGGEKHMVAGEEGRHAVTRFRVLQQFTRGCYAEAELITGRTHQIRVHAQHLGAPLAGDPKYASAEQQAFWKDLGLKRLFLHAAEVELDSPAGAPLKFSAPLPPALKECLGRLEAA